MKRLLSVVLFAMLVGSVSASSSGGVMYLHDPDDTLVWGPLVCHSDMCQQVQHLVLPRLFSYQDSGINDVSLSTGQDTVLASQVDYGADGRTITLTLRDDLVWEDGTPVTAYDAFYTFLTFRHDVNGFGNSTAFLPLDEKTLLIERNTPVCSLYTVQMTILPAHALQADFVAQAATFGFTADQDPSDQLNAWLAAHPWNAQAVAQNPYHITMPITLKDRDMAQVSPGDFLRVQLGQGDDSMGLHIYSNLPTASSIDYFLAGQLDALRNIPINRWADIVNAPDVKFLRVPTGEKASLIFNFTDPTRPQPYQDQFGNLLEQKPHPILSDLAVRQAIAAAIDIDELIKVGLNGFGITTHELFDSNTDLTTPDISRFDVALAERLLTEAGWVRAAVGRDQVRQCQDCTTASNGTALNLNIISDSTYETQAMMVTLKRQLERVGFSITVNAYGEDVNMALRSQSFDLAFVKRHESNVSVAQDFMTQNDGGENVSSYSNPDLDALLSRVDDPTAAHACDSTQVHDLYAEVEQEIASDLPQLMLFAYEDPLAIRDWVLTNTDFEYLMAPLLHIYQWQVYYGPEDE